MALIVKAFFSKIEGDYFAEERFPFSHIKMTIPEYLWHITFYFAFACIAWSYYLQETLFRRQLLVFSILMTGELLDFILRCNTIFFRIGDYPFSYDSFMFLVFGITILTAKK
jgi:hypothetical protein